MPSAGAGLLCSTKSKAILPPAAKLCGDAAFIFQHDLAHDHTEKVPISG